MAKRRAGSQNVTLTPDHEKSRVTLTSLHAGGVPHMVGKLLTRATTMLMTSPQSELCTKRYEFSKLRKSLFQEFWDSQLGSLETKWHLGVGPMAIHKEYYKGEGSGFLQVQAMVNLMNLCLFVIHPCTKSVPTMH
jgi:hypothetical protein